MEQLIRDTVYSNRETAAPLRAAHFVLTRFSLVWGALRVQGQLQDEARWRDYLEARIPVFVSFCLPSLLAQTRKPDAWLVGFDEQTRDSVEPVLEAIADRLNQWIVPVWQRRLNGEPESGMGAFRREIQKRLSGDRDWLITTRLDNDDAISQDFCDCVQHYASHVVHCKPALRNFWISFPYGLQYTETGASVRVLPANAFLTRCERLDTADSDGTWDTALSLNHTKVLLQTTFFPTTYEPMWLQHVDGTNLVGRRNERLYRVCDLPQALSRFGIAESAIRRAAPAQAVSQTDTTDGSPVITKS